MYEKTVLVTGSSRGIGKEIAIAFAKKNFNVVINCSISIEEMNLVVTEIKKYNENVIGIACDVGDFLDTKKMFEEIYLKFGDIDILINNAGISYIGVFSEMNLGDIQKIISTNLLSVINCSQIAVKSMISKKNGVIINISSIWGSLGASCEVVYAASKGGVEAFSKSLAKELGPSKIRVNAIACGVIDTKMNSWISEEEKNNIIDNISLMRFGTCKEVADLCLFLSSENSSYITGQIINIDGGYI